MADIEIIRESADGFTHQGHSVSYTETYLKVRRSFRRHALKVLKGAPLSIFWEIALSDEPLDIPTICEDTGYTSPTTVCAALDFLVERRFIEEIGKSGWHGAKLYRAIGYTWSGSDRNAPPDVVATESRIPNNGIWNSTLENEVRLTKTGIRRAKSGIRPRIVVVDSLVQNSKESSLRKQQQTTTKTRKLLQDCGIFGKPLIRLSEIIDVETAQAWLDWRAEAPSYLRNPVGVIVNALLTDPTSKPPTKSKEEQPRRRPVITGKLAPDSAREEDKPE